ncbi:hypothetical protein ADUPG1_000271 [Aduncisulcus paluster]|uniref:Uncharacterized protein n=1 Tax=Aduncisulcus paluster TaxID=2918883 RepID=A0ABQ5K8W4_9EUKA|nr:hypothetical protein ADUPG1_000271 [Aduncisulcus paluster]
MAAPRRPIAVKSARKTSTTAAAIAKMRGYIPPPKICRKIIRMPVFPSLETILESRSDLVRWSGHVEMCHGEPMKFIYSCENKHDEALLRHLGKVASRCARAINAGGCPKYGLSFAEWGVWLKTYEIRIPEPVFARKLLNWFPDGLQCSLLKRWYYKCRGCGQLVHRGFYCICRETPRERLLKTLELSKKIF